MLILVTRDRKKHSRAKWEYFKDDDSLCVSSRFGTFKLDTIQTENRFVLIEYSFPFFTWTLEFMNEDEEGNKWYQWRYSRFRDQILGIRFGAETLAKSIKNFFENLS